MHILIIEDEKQLCQSIAEGLRMDGYEADTCFDGDEGLELCLVENYDLILLDLNLPGVDGLEILRQFRDCGDCAAGTGGEKKESARVNLTESGNFPAGCEKRYAMV